MSTLLIIGNGFDRYIGLDSTYENFFTHHLPDETRNFLKEIKENYEFRISGEFENPEFFNHLSFPYDRESVKNKFSPSTSIKTPEDFSDKRN